MAMVVYKKWVSLSSLILLLLFVGVMATVKENELSERRFFSLSKLSLHLTPLNKVQLYF